MAYKYLLHLLTVLLLKIEYCKMLSLRAPDLQKTEKDKPGTLGKMAKDAS